MAPPTPSMVGVPDSATATDAPHAGLVLDRAGLAERAGVPAFVVDLVIGAGLLTPLDNGSDGERFSLDDVEMLIAARTLVGEGVAVEELAALAMRHATNVENLIEDAIDLLKRHVDREGRDKAALVASVNRLVRWPPNSSSATSRRRSGLGRWPASETTLPEPPEPSSSKPGASTGASIPSPSTPRPEPTSNAASGCAPMPAWAGRHRGRRRHRAGRRRSLLGCVSGPGGARSPDPA